MRQEDCSEFKASLDHIVNYGVRLDLKNRDNSNSHKSKRRKKKKKMYSCFSGASPRV